MRCVRIMVLVILTTVATSAIAAEKTLPRKWIGEYTSHRELDAGYYQLTLKDISVKGSKLSIRASGTYRSGKQLSQVRMDWIIDTDTLFVEMWDVAVGGDLEDYDATGAYQGSISYELDRIFAIWRNTQTNNAGTLKLRSVEAFPDADS